MSQTTVPVVKAKLLELFKTAVDPSTEVWRGRPTEDHQPAENVYVGDVRGRREWKNLGMRGPVQVEETYSVTVTIEVWRDGADVEGCEARLWEIVNRLEETVRLDVKLGITENVQWTIPEEFEQTSQSGEDGWLCSAVFGVAVTARI